MDAARAVLHGAYIRVAVEEPHHACSMPGAELQLGVADTAEYFARLSGEVKEVGEFAARFVSRCPTTVRAQQSAWLFSVLDHFQFDDRVPHSAVSIRDKYAALQNETIAANNLLEILIASALIALKIETVELDRSPAEYVMAMVRLAGLDITWEAMQQLESDILMCLSFDVAAGTVVDLVSALLEGTFAHVVVAVQRRAVHHAVMLLTDVAACNATLMFRYPLELLGASCCALVTFKLQMNETLQGLARQIVAMSHHSDRIDLDELMFCISDVQQTANAVAQGELSQPFLRKYFVAERNFVWHLMPTLLAPVDHTRFWEMADLGAGHQ
mmetsp:Transcript_50826/g.111265  ORF Transcript_50826/g.111265 Transcript_50826/m.111265 type:complete len:328 (-) Transcript_50826:284-1267(-)